MIMDRDSARAKRLASQALKSRVAGDDSALDQYLQDVSQHGLITPVEEIRLARLAQKGDTEAIPDPAGQPGAGDGGHQVRPGSGREVHQLRSLVDPPGYTVGAGTPWAFRPGAAQPRGGVVEDPEGAAGAEGDHRPGADQRGDRPAPRHEPGDGGDARGVERRRGPPRRADRRQVERFVSEGANSAHAEVEERLLREQIDDALSTLRERDALVLRLYYGLGDGREHTLEEIGQKLGITRERVRQLRDRALKELREGDRGAALASFSAV
jgi:RNA polymerase primary sigma factor